MKAFSFFRTSIAVSLACALSAQAAEGHPAIAGAWVQLRKEPLFDAPTLPLAAVWGASLPAGDGFEVEKRYGRWLYGKPLPLKKMLKKDYAPSGWLYSRMLLPEGDSSTFTKEDEERFLLTSFYSRLAWKDLGLNPAEGANRLFSFLEGLVLSKKTMQAFRATDESVTQERPRFSLFPAAFAEDAPEKGFGLTGANLSFLKEEFEQQQNSEKKVVYVKKMKSLQVPKLKALTNSIKERILARYMAEKYMDLPALSHEEVDGYIYMRAVVQRSLEACPAKIRDFWRGRTWTVYRFLRLKNARNDWLQLRLPGNAFAVSAKAIDAAANEAELAFLLTRPLVREAGGQRNVSPNFGKKWPSELASLAESAWADSMKSLSTKDTPGVDVGDEITADILTAECVSRAGYSPLAALNYLRRLVGAKDQPWAAWFHEHAIGLSYRNDRLGELLDEAREKHLFPAGTAVNTKRFTQASRFWNILP